MAQPELDRAEGGGTLTAPPASETPGRAAPWRSPAFVAVFSVRDEQTLDGAALEQLDVSEPAMVDLAAPDVSPPASRPSSRTSAVNQRVPTME